MEISGTILIGAGERVGETTFSSVDPATGKTLTPAFAEAGATDVAAACALADQAFATFGETDPETRAAFLDAIGAQIVALGDEPDRPRDGRKRAAACAAGGRARAHDRPVEAVRRRRAAGRLDRRHHRPGAARSRAAAAPRFAPPQRRARAGRGVRRVQLPARLLGRGRRHRLGLRRRLSGGGQGSPRASRHRRTRRAGDPRGGGPVRPARGRLLLPPRHQQRTRWCAGRRSADQGGRLHRLARRRSRAGAHRGRAPTSRSRSMPRCPASTRWSCSPARRGRAVPIWERRSSSR